MPYYETVLIARQDLTDAQVKDIVASFSKVITDEGGKISKTEFWGLKSFAYRINKGRKGHYVLLETETEAAALHEMERQMRLHEDVVRFLTIRLDAPAEGPSPMAEKNDRNDDSKRDYKNKDYKNKDKKEAA